MFSVMPFFRSFVVATCGLSWWYWAGAARLQREQLSGGRGEQVHGSPVATYHEDVLNPDATLARQVHARLDGDWDPVCESTRAVVPEHRRLVHLKAHAVP